MGMWLCPAGCLIGPSPLCFMTAVLEIGTVTTLGQSFPSVGLRFLCFMTGLDYGISQGHFWWELPGAYKNFGIYLHEWGTWFLKCSLPGRCLVTPVSTILKGPGD